MSRWSPRALPIAREKTWLRLTRPDPDLPGRLRHEEIATCAYALATSGLYWASPEMTALALAAGATLPEVCWASAYRPARNGILVWGGGLGAVDVSGMYIWSGRAPKRGAFGQPAQPRITLPYDAVSWFTHDDGIEIWCWARFEAITAAAIAAGGTPTLPADVMPPLVPLVSTSEHPVRTTPTPVEELDPEDRTLARPVLLALAAAWALMQQPKLADREILPSEARQARRAARAGLSEPDVTIIDLRKVYRPQEPREESGDAPSRVYRHRWVVSGHWRQQPHGRDRALRRQQWIPSYTKGPDGAPLLETERVNVWRR